MARADRVTAINAAPTSTGVTVIGGREWLEHRDRPGGRHPGSTVRVLDVYGRDVAPGTVGRVFLRPSGGCGVDLPLRQRHQHGRRRLRGRSVTLGWLDADGYLCLADRAADVLVTATGRGLPGAGRGGAGRASRRALVGRDRPARRSATAAGIERVHAVVDTAGADVTAAALHAWAAQRLPPAATPGTVELVDRPLRDDAGKVRRSRLRSARVSQA